MYDPMIILYLQYRRRYSHQVQPIPHINTRTILISVREINKLRGQKTSIHFNMDNHYIQITIRENMGHSG